MHWSKVIVLIGLVGLLAACDGSSNETTSSAADTSLVDSGVSAQDSGSSTDTTLDDTNLMALDSDEPRDADQDSAIPLDAEPDTEDAHPDTAEEDTSDAGPQSDVCEGEECPPDCELECPEGETRCDGERGVSVCEQDAVGCSRWVTSDPCAQDQICQTGACVEACVAEDTRCLNATTLQTCRDGRLEQSQCPGGCDPATRECFVCPDGAWRCEDDGDRIRLERCEGGSRWLLEDVCQQCGCAANQAGIIMQCMFVRDATPTTCTTCTEDGTTCLP